MQVQKRNGKLEPLCINKIREVINKAVVGMPEYVNPAEIEGTLKVKLKDGITTEAIQKELVLTATELCSINTPSYRYVAGRLYLYNHIKQTICNRGYDYDNYFFHVSSQVRKGLYDSKILKEYSKSDLELAGTWIDTNRDQDYDLAGAIILSTRYLLKDELPQEAYLTLALLIASVEREEDRLKYAKDIYDALSLRKISLATPFLSNLRKVNGNLSSCFIVAVDDSLKSIYANLTNAANISAAGGGLGVYLSRIRATGSTVKGRENSSGGVLSWSKLFNDTAVAVDQGKQICPLVA